MSRSGTPRRRYRIALIEGDGIGPELIEGAVAALRAVALAFPVEFEFCYEHAGADHFRRTGVALSDETLERLRTEYDATLKGPAGLPSVRTKDGTEAGLVGGILRTQLDTYANLRPIKLMPGVRSALVTSEHGIDYVIVRENSEGLYASRQSGFRAGWGAVDMMVVTRTATERIARVAFETARKRSGAPSDGVRRVTCVDKSNVLRSYAFFREVFDEVAAQYPDIAVDYLYTDAAAQSLVLEPERLDVVLTENFAGDVLSDLGAGTVGGLGLCGSANVGDDHAYFEPLHGSAPTIAGQDRANPTSQILSAAMMLEYLGEDDAARSLRVALEQAYAEGAIQLNRSGQPLDGTINAAAAVAERIHSGG